MRLLLGAFIFVLTMLAGLQAQAAGGAGAEKAVVQLIGSYAEAREQRNARALSSILAPDADQLVSSGEWRRGRDELVRGMISSSERNSGARTIQVHPRKAGGAGSFQVTVNGRLSDAATAGDLVLVQAEAEPQPQHFSDTSHGHSPCWQI